MFAYICAFTFYDASKNNNQSEIETTVEQIYFPTYSFSAPLFHRYLVEENEVH